MQLPLILSMMACLVLSWFFSCVEGAYLFSNKLQIELQEKQGMLVGKIFSRFSKRRSFLSVTVLLGKMLSISLLVMLIVSFLYPFFLQYLPVHIVLLYIVIVLVITLVVLFVVELVSFNLFTIHPNRILSSLSLPFAFFYTLLLPFAHFVMWLYRKASSIFGLTYSEEKSLFGLSVFINHIRNGNRANPSSHIELDTKIFHNALEFKSVRVRECMIPRTEIVAVSIDDELQKLKNAFMESGHSKIIIYRESIDDVIGYCHSLALFKKPETIKEILNPIIVVPETTLANELMIRFIAERKSLAVVIDEFGGTAGLVSMEDLIEEIFGDIEDEHDEDNLIEQSLGENIYLLSARLEVDYLNDKYNWNLPEGDYETLGGLILSHTEEIPKMGQEVSVPPFLFTIQSSDENRINLVKMGIKPEGLAS